MYHHYLYWAIWEISRGFDLIKSEGPVRGGGVVGAWTPGYLDAFNLKDSQYVLGMLLGEFLKLLALSPGELGKMSSFCGRKAEFKLLCYQEAS